MESEDWVLSGDCTLPCGIALLGTDNSNCGYGRWFMFVHSVSTKTMGGVLGCVVQAVGKDEWRAWDGKLPFLLVFLDGLSHHLSPSLPPL